MAQIYDAVAGNIALLHALNNKPEIPSINDADPQAQRDNDGTAYRLSFKHEKKLAEAFAMLLSHTDDPERVGAVCLEELAEGDGVIISSAVNYGPQDERREIFDRIARVLGKPNDIESSTSSDDEFKEIIAACQGRLLGRLRSRHARIARRGKDQPPIISRLEGALRFRAQHQKKRTITLCIEIYAEPLAALWDKLEQLSRDDARSDPGLDLIVAMLKLIVDLLASNTIDSVLLPLPNHLGGHPGWCTKNLVEKLKKLAQYQESAKYLIWAARRFPFIRNLRLREVKRLGEKAFSYDPKATSGLFARYLRLLPTLPTQDQKKFKQYLARLQKSPSSVQHEVLSSLGQTKRVHAEVLLLMYYEQHSEIANKPRIISSNKQACFLCDLFVRSHGGFCTPGSHGRLYPRWRLPTPEEIHLPVKFQVDWLQKVEVFNGNIEKSIKNCLLRADVPRVPDPNESMVFIAGILTPSVASVADENRSAQRSRHDSLMAPSPVLHTFPPIRTPESRATLRKDMQRDLDMPQEPDRKDTGKAGGNSSASIIGEATRTYELVPGQAVSCPISPSESLRFHSRRLHLEVTYEQASLAMTTPQASEGAHIMLIAEWLPSVDVRLADVFQGSVDVDAGWTTLDPFEGILFTENGLVFRRKEEVVVLRAELEKI